MIVTGDKFELHARKGSKKHPLALRTCKHLLAPLHRPAHLIYYPVQAVLLQHQGDCTGCQGHASHL